MKAMKVKPPMKAVAAPKDLEEFLQAPPKVLSVKSGSEGEEESETGSEMHESEVSESGGVLKRPAANVLRDRLKTHQWNTAKRQKKLPEYLRHAFDTASRADQTVLINNLFTKDQKTGKYIMNLKDKNVTDIVKRTEHETASMGFQGIIREVAEGMMPGQDTREKSEKLDKAVKEGRCWVEVTNAGIELYNFPQANRSKGVTLTSSVETEQRGKVSGDVHGAARAGLEDGGVSLRALTAGRAGSAPALTTSSMGAIGAPEQPDGVEAREGQDIGVEVLGQDVEIEPLHARERSARPAPERLDNRGGARLKNT